MAINAPGQNPKREQPAESLLENVPHGQDSDQAELMIDRDSLKSYCLHCGKQFGNAWQFVGLKQHLWEIHGISGHTTFNGKVIKFPNEECNQ